MELIKTGMAGTVESGDILVEIEQTGAPGVDIQLDSTVMGLYGRRIREVIAELRKVVTPTRRELIRYTITVLVFVAVVIVAVIGLDLVFGTISTQLFTGTAEQ